MTRRWLVVLFALLALSVGTSGGNGTGPTTLFAQASSLTRSQAAPAASAQTPREPWESRTRAVTIDLSTLPDRATTSAPSAADGAQVRIDLFDGRSIQAVFERFDPNSSGVTWVGSVPAIPSSRVTLVYGGGLLAANIVLPDATYSIRPVPLDPQDPRPPTGQPLHILAEINQGALPPEAEPIEVAVAADAAAQAADTVMADTADTIDVLIVYTALAEAWAGGPIGIINWINLGVSETNSAYENSGVFQRVQLLTTERVAYTEVSSFGTNLSNLRNGTGLLNVVPPLREVYGADLVSMIVHPASPDACGIGFLMTTISTSFASSGFNVVDAPCISQQTLAHEFGHNMGLRHDWYMDNALTPSTYAHGHVNATARFRTIMAYPNSCQSLGFSCTRLVRFSNPDLFFSGFPMGIPAGTSISCPTSNANNMMCDSDERRALNDTALTVANFRQAKTDRPPVITGHPSSQTVTRGQSVTLEVNATGLGPFTYQWYRGQSPSTLSPIAGATGRTYAFVPGGDGMWLEKWFLWVRVSNQIGGVNSLAATVTLQSGGSSVGRRMTGPDDKAPALLGGTRPPKDAVVGSSASTNAGAQIVLDLKTVDDEIDVPVVCSARITAVAASLARIADRSLGPDLMARVWALRRLLGC